MLDTSIDLFQEMARRTSQHIVGTDAGKEVVDLGVITWKVALLFWSHNLSVGKVYIIDIHGFSWYIQD